MGGDNPAIMTAMKMKPLIVVRLLPQWNPSREVVF